MANHQTAGRGRQGRPWRAPAGTSLLASVLLRPALPAFRLHLATAAVALAAAEALEVAAHVRPQLKWPNDLMAGGRKLAGVLAEADLPAVVVGVGVNLNWPAPLPGELQGVAVSANQLVGHEIDAEAVLTGLLDSLGARYGHWHDVAREYRQRCATVGQMVRVELTEETVEGTAVGLSEDGHLLVDAGSGRRTITAGDVIHLRTAPPGKG